MNMQTLRISDHTIVGYEILDQTKNKTLALQALYQTFEATSYEKLENHDTKVYYSKVKDSLGLDDFEYFHCIYGDIEAILQRTEFYETACYFRSGHPRVQYTSLMFGICEKAAFDYLFGENRYELELLNYFANDARQINRWNVFRLLLLSWSRIWNPRNLFGAKLDRQSVLIEVWPEIASSEFPLVIVVNQANSIPVYQPITFSSGKMCMTEYPNNSEIITYNSQTNQQLGMVIHKKGKEMSLICISASEHNRNDPDILIGFGTIIELDRHRNITSNRTGVIKILTEEDKYSMLKTEEDLLRETVSATDLLPEELRDVKFEGEASARNVDFRFVNLAEFAGASLETGSVYNWRGMWVTDVNFWLFSTVCFYFAMLDRSQKAFI